MSLKTHKFARKTFYVDAVRVSEANIEEVAAWCNGTLETDETGHTFIAVKVLRPLTDRQGQAYIGDWVLFASNSFKVFTPKAFDKSFDKVKTLTKAQADEAGIKPPHEPRPKNEKKAGPKPTPPKRRPHSGKPLTNNVGEVMKQAQEKAQEKAEPLDAPVVTVTSDEPTPLDVNPDEMIKTSTDKLIDPDTAAVTEAKVEVRKQADIEADAIISEVLGTNES